MQLVSLKHWSIYISHTQNEQHMDVDYKTKIEKYILSDHKEGQKETSSI